MGIVFDPAVVVTHQRGIMCTLVIFITREATQSLGP